MLEGSLLAPGVCHSLLQTPENHFPPLTDTREEVSHHRPSCASTCPRPIRPAARPGHVLVFSPHYRQLPFWVSLPRVRAASRLGAGHSLLTPSANAKVPATTARHCTGSAERPSFLPFASLLQHHFFSGPRCPPYLKLQFPHPSTPMFPTLLCFAFLLPYGIYHLLIYYIIFLLRLFYFCLPLL